MGDNAPSAWIDHVVLAVPDVDVAVTHIEANWGVSPTVGGSHDGRGTRNVLLALGGSTYLEVIGPDAAQADPGQPRAFGVDDLVAGGAGVLAGWALGTDDIEALAVAAEGVGYRAGRIHSMSRTRPDGVRLDWRLTLSSAIQDPTQPFLIDWGSTASPAGDSATGVQLSAFRAMSPDAGPLRGLLASSGVVMEIDEGSPPRLSLTLDTPMGPVELHS